jgi:hypothetical protein
VGSALIDLSEQYVVPDASGFFAVVLVVGYYEFWVGSNHANVNVPDDSATYSFETLIVPSIPPTTPITGSAVATASSTAAGIVKTDDTVLDPVAATGWFYPADATELRTIANKTNNKVAVCKGLSKAFGWNAASTAAESASVYRPSDTGALAPGRWEEVVVSGRGVVTPAQITASQDNYNPGGVGEFLRLSTDASRNITGLTFTPGQLDGEKHFIANTGAQNIVLVHESASSTAANRFHNTTGTDITLTPDQQAMIWYDATTARWRVTKQN